MGLTKNSVGLGAVDREKSFKDDGKIVVALAGNPNVGKSTIFNALTGMKQHTGNWPGKTVSSARGEMLACGKEISLVDIPGTYSLMAHSPEEEVASDFIIFGGADKTVVVCDATCLERNLNLVLQTAEAFRDVIICVNLVDEAEKKNISVDFERLSLLTGLKVIGTSARNGEGLEELSAAMAKDEKRTDFFEIRYSQRVEKAVSLLEEALGGYVDQRLNRRWVALRLIDGNEYILKTLNDFLGEDISQKTEIKEALFLIRSFLSEKEAEEEITKMVSYLSRKIAKECVALDSKNDSLDRRLDKILTGKYTAIPIMLLLLALVFFITVKGANYPSQAISSALFSVQAWLECLFRYAGVSGYVTGFLLDGVFKVSAWVVSVMLPPMAIFFPMFTLLEDFGYLPRVAFVLDKCFKKCSSCGKQALTMAMGFGCNAAGVVGCRIIDSPRERLIAIITNSFVPCNGKFPALIMIISLFFGSNDVFKAVMLMLFVLLGVGITLGMSKLLSKTVLKGVPSAFTLELPPYRTPKIVPVIVSSIFDRTIFVLGRAVASAAPAGAIIWLLANISCGGESLLSMLVGFLEPFGSVMGLDGVILTAFLLGLPANEIVVPIMLMTYLGEGTLTDATGISAIGEILLANGWSIKTALCTLLFFMFHWPCATTCLTAYKETKSIRWTAATILVPTAVGALLCVSVNELFLLLR